MHAAPVRRVNLFSHHGHVLEVGTRLRVAVVELPVVEGLLRIGGENDDLHVTSRFASQDPRVMDGQLSRHELDLKPAEELAVLGEGFRVHDSVHVTSARLVHEDDLSNRGIIVYFLFLLARKSERGKREKHENKKEHCPKYAHGFLHWLRV
jgi:hypothetical protein